MTNRKTLEGMVHQNRDAQFVHINSTGQEFLKDGQPVISADAKKKELLGNFKNGGREYRPKGKPKYSSS